MDSKLKIYKHLFRLDYDEKYSFWNNSDIISKFSNLFPESHSNTSSGILSNYDKKHSILNKSTHSIYSSDNFKKNTSTKVIHLIEENIKKVNPLSQFKNLGQRF